MNPFEIFITFISWGSDGKNRPIIYIDTGTLFKLPLSAISNKKPIGRLTETDKQKLLEFLNK
ncbi:MAG: hypothetical protein FWB86_08045 [Treponema sp.]|nr:hypothetical protein [Treponema sp.]MCL2251934.1 hypothetical protein [Treponema sp.]